MICNVFARYPLPGEEVVVGAYLCGGVLPYLRGQVVEKWIVVVEALPPDEAEAAFAAWRRENPEWSDMLNADDILIDTVRGIGGVVLRRYRVAKRVL